MTEYRIPQVAARQIAVGVFRDIGAFIKAADQADLKKFRDEYERRKAAPIPAPVKRRYSRNRRVLHQ